MRTTLITQILAMASAVAAAQTTEGAREPADGRSWFDDLADFWGYAPACMFPSWHRGHRRNERPVNAS